MEAQFLTMGSVQQRKSLLTPAVTITMVIAFRSIKALIPAKLFQALKAMAAETLEALEQEETGAIAAVIRVHHAAPAVQDVEVVIDVAIESSAVPESKTSWQVLEQNKTSL